MWAKPLTATARGKTLRFDAIIVTAAAAGECQKPEQGWFEPVK